MEFQNHAEFDISRPLGTSAYETSIDPETGLTIGLPKVVWLRGDEPYFHEFSLDADQAMEILGIRRSRLNQISGKELRVARARMGRYIRPVYRPIDIEQYQAWIRPSSSHVKSTDIINTAVKALEEKADILEKTLTSEKPDWVEKLELQLKLRIKESEANAEEKFQQLHSHILQKTNDLQVILSGLFIEKNEQFQRLLDNINKIDEQTLKENTFKEVTSIFMKDLQSEYSQLKLKVSELQNQQLLFQKNLSEHISLIEELIIDQKSQVPAFKAVANIRKNKRSFKSKSLDLNKKNQKNKYAPKRAHSKKFT